MKLRITTLNENTAGRGGFLAEWGLSILIETADAKVLFDTGAGIAVSHNADVIGIDLGMVDRIVLSHSHADHTGGLREVLRRIRKNEVEVIAHPDIWATKYRCSEGKEDAFRGMPFQRKELESFGARFNLTREPVKMGASVMTSGEVPMVTDFEKLASSWLIEKNGKLVADELRDDQAVFVITEKGLVVVSGCAHRGIINTLYHAQQVSGIKEIYAVIGGSHLVDASRERIQSTVSVLKELGVEKIGLCHCTGFAAVSVFAQEFGEKFFSNNAGTVFTME